MERIVRRCSALLLACSALSGCDLNPASPTRGFNPPQAPLPPPANVAGIYTFEVSAPERCTQLPDDARNREYEATIEQTEGALDIALTTRDGQPLSRHLPGAIVGSDVFIVFGSPVSNPDFPDLDLNKCLVDPRTPTTAYYICGRARGRIAESGISGLLDGYVQYGAEEGASSCGGSDFSFSLTRAARPPA